MKLSRSRLMRTGVFGRVTLPHTVDFSVFANGAIPSQFIGANWQIVSGKAVCTPTLGDTEFVTNGGMETGSPPGSWTPTNATSTSVSDPRTGSSGTKSIEVANVGANFGQVGQAITLTLGSWYYLSGWVKDINSQPIIRSLNNNDFITPASTNSGAWEFRVGTGRCSLANNGVRLANTSNLDLRSFRCDDISLKEIVMASTLAYLNTSLNGVAVVKAAWNIVSTTHAGVVGWWDGLTPYQNCLVAYHDGLYAKLVQFDGSNRTELIPATAATYSAGAQLEIRRPSGTNTYKLYYNNAQVGTDQTVSLTNIINNTRFGILGMYAGNQCLNFQLA